MQVIINTPSYNEAYDARLYRLDRGDVIRMSHSYVLSIFGRKIKRLNVGATYRYHDVEFLLKQRNKRPWWKFWLPKYLWANFMVLGIGGDKSIA